MKKIITLAKKTFSHWNMHRPGEKGAALSYYAIFSIAPLLILSISLVHLFFGKRLIEDIILRFISDNIGQGGSQFIGTIINQPQASIGIIATILSLLTLLFASIGVLSQLDNTLDELWEVAGSDTVIKRGSIWSRLWHIVKGKLGYLMIIPVLGLLLFFSIEFSVFIKFISSIRAFAFLPIDSFQIFEPIVSFALTVALFWSLFKILPNKFIPWRETLLGATLTALLFLFGEFMISYFLARFASLSTYGAAGSLVALMLWVFYSSQIFFLGASFTYIYSKNYGYLKRHS